MIWISRALRAAVVAWALCVALSLTADAAATTFLTGTVTASGKGVAGAVVSAAGNSVIERTRTDARGRFIFPNVTPGAYVVTVVANEGMASIEVDLSAAGADIALNLGPKQLGIVPVTAAAPIRRSGTDLTLGREQLTRSPAAGSFPELLVQLPGAARGANGVVHINGDHGDINYVVDGVSIPQELNRNIGTEFNANDVSFVDVIEGAYPAQYGERFASVLNISTRAVAASSGLNGAVDVGSFGLLDATLGYQGALGAGALTTALRNSVTQRGLDPPNLDSPHNNAADANQFVRYTLPRGNDYLNLTISHAHQTFQLPIDVTDGEPRATDDDELQDDVFAAVQERHALGTRGSLSYGLGVKRSHIVDYGDPANDWAFGEVRNVAAGGSPADCANALSSGSFSAVTCGYSLSGERTAVDYKFNLDDALASGNHQLGWGAVYDSTHVAKRFAVTLQPGNFLAPLFTPASPNAPFTVVDDAPNDGHTEALYVQDAWRMGASYELDYGVRADAFQLRSAQFARGFSQLSPRLKLTRILGPRSSVYAYYGRFFTPFSFENVSPTTAQLLNLPLQRAVAAFDLKPQRDSDYEIGGHLPLGQGDLGLRVMRKNATDLIDDTQVGVTLLHQDINYALGRIATQSLYYQLPLQRSGRFYFTLNHTYSVNRGCETQLLAPCFGAPDDWTPADHEQRWGSTLGDVINDRHGGWIAISSEYGSGLSSAGCPPTVPGFCKYTPHTTFDVERGIALGARTKLTMRIRNLLDDRYMITYLNAQGNHWYTQRAFDAGLAFGQP